MKIFNVLLLATGLTSSVSSMLTAQDNPQNKVIITGVRFAYPLVEKWIQVYTAENPNAQIAIETRTITDPEKYDLLIEAYDQERLIKEGRETISIGRYALVPVANSKSAFAREFGEKGLTESDFKQIFFHDIYAEKGKSITAPYTVYTRLQKAGAPFTFAKYFGYEQQQIKGKAIAGADEHLIKALLKDDTGITYTVPGLAFDLHTRKPADGLTIIPVDLDNNGRVSKDEKLVDNLDHLVEKFESEKIKNVPIEYIHLSITKTNSNTEARKFLIWVASHGEQYLHQFGYLKPEAKRLQGEKEQLERWSAVK